MFLTPYVDCIVQTDWNSWIWNQTIWTSCCSEILIKNDFRVTGQFLTLYLFRTSKILNLNYVTDWFWFVSLILNFTVRNKVMVTNAEMVFCYQNCSDLLWEKIVLVSEKNIRTIYLRSERSEHFFKLNAFLTTFWGFLRSNTLEKLEFKLEKINEV